MKKLFIILFFIIILFTMLSCRKSKSDVLVLTALVHSGQSSIEYKRDSEIVKAFNYKYPNIKIELKSINNEEDYYQRIQSMTSIPDIFIISPYYYTRYYYNNSTVVEKSLALDLRPYITEKIKAEFDPNIFSPQGSEGEIYTLSHTFLLTHLMYANKKIMDELNISFPKTQKELLAQRDIIITNGYTPIAVGNKEGMINSLLFSAMIGRFGGKEWLSRAIVGEEAYFSDTNFVNALNVIKVLADNKMFNKEVLGMSYLQGYQEFVQGKAVYLVDNSLKINPIMQDMGADSDDIDIYVYPEIATESVRYSTSAIYSEGFAINSKISKERVSAAFKFIMFSLGEEGSDIRMKNGELPTYKINTKDSEMKPLTRKFFELRDKITTTYAIESIIDKDGIIVLDDLITSIMTKDKTPEQVAYDYEYWVMKNDFRRVKE